MVIFHSYVSLPEGNIAGIAYITIKLYITLYNTIYIYIYIYITILVSPVLNQLGAPHDAALVPVVLILLGTDGPNQVVGALVPVSAGETTTDDARGGRRKNREFGTEPLKKQAGKMWCIELW